MKKGEDFKVSLTNFTMEIPKKDFRGILLLLYNPVTKSYDAIHTIDDKGDKNTLNNDKYQEYFTSIESSVVKRRW